MCYVLSVESIRVSMSMRSDETKGEKDKTVKRKVYFEVESSSVQSSSVQSTPIPGLLLELFYTPNQNIF